MASSKVINYDKIGTIENPLYQGEKATNLDMYTIEMIQQYGESFYFKYGDFDMLIDGGNVNDGENVAEILKKNMSDQSLELVIATHAHSDHIGGILSALNTAGNIDMVVDYGYQRSDYQTSIYYRDYVNENAKKYCAVSDAVNNKNGCSKRIYITDELYIDILNTGQYLNPDRVLSSSNGNNEASVTFILTYKEIKYYLSGDLDSSGESKLSSNGELTDVTIMKATHHGSANGNKTSTLSKLKPEIVVISAALVNGSQMHPTQTALNAFKSAASKPKIYCNFTNGTMKFTTDGTYIPTLQGTPTIKGYLYNGVKVTGEENMLFTQTKWYKQNRS